MGNRYIDTALVDKAIKFATEAHKNTERNGHGSPYVLHVLEAGCIVETMTSDKELIAAAILHDTVEDTYTTLEDIEREFGKRVRDLVESESEPPVLDKSEEDSWKERKIAAINRIKNSSRDSKIVAMGDKLSNMRALARDYYVLGDKLWDKFHVNDPLLHEWHYRGLGDALSDLKGTFAYDEFMFLLNSTFREYHQDEV